MMRPMTTPSPVRANRAKTEWLRVESKAADEGWRREYEIDGDTYFGIVAVYRDTEGRRLGSDRFVALAQYPDGRYLRLDAKESRAEAERVCDEYLTTARVKKL